MEYRSVPLPEMAGYRVSERGDVLSPRGNPLRGSTVCVRGKMITRSRLVALAYHGQPPEGRNFAVLVNPDLPEAERWAPSNVRWASGGRDVGAPGRGVQERRAARVEAAVQRGLSVLDTTGDATAAISAAAERALDLAHRPAP